MNRLPILFNVAVACVGLALCSAAAAQQKSEITITRQPGILYLPSHALEEKQYLIEKEALSAADLPGS